MRSACARVRQAEAELSLCEVLDRVLIQIRLVVCSVDKALEMGPNWWTQNPDFQARAAAGTASSPVAPPVSVPG